MLKKLFSTEAKPGAFFRRIDWTAFWGATAISFLVYFFTLGPSVGLEDSGELATAADHLGVPHPPGYPFWTLCCWIFCRVFSWVHYMGQPTPAWAVSLFSAVAGAFAAGCTAMLICRSGSDMLDSMDQDAQDGCAGEDVTRRHALMGFAGGLGGALVFAFSPVEWSQSTIVEIYSLNALFLMAVFLLSYRWMRKPSDRILWLTAFVFGLGLTNYQVLLMAAVPLAFIILLKDIRLFRDFTLILIPVALTAQVLQIGSKMRASAAMSADVINKFDPVLAAQSCPSGIVLWIAFALVVAAPVVGKVLARRGRPAKTVLAGALGTGLAGVLLIILSATAFAGMAAWDNPEFAPLLEPAKYAWIALFLAAACVLSLGAVFAPEDAPLSDRRVWAWLAGAGFCAFIAVSVAAGLKSAGSAGYRGEAFSWAKPAFTLFVGLALLVGLSLLTPRKRGLAFAVPVASVQLVVFILLSKGAMNGLTHPSTWWFFWPCIWNFVVLGLATVALPNGKAIGPAMLFAELGVSFYVYMPIVSDLRNPPMNWGYPRTWEGFKHAILRGQYEQITMPSLFTAEGFDRFCKQMGFYFQDLRMQFTLVAAALALIPFALWKGVVKTKGKVVSIPAARIAVWLYVATAALVIVFSELFESWTDGEVPGRLDKYLLLAMALLALVGVGAMLVRQTLVIIRQMRGKEVLPENPDAPVRVRFLADDVTQQWLIAVGSCFAIMSFFLVALANVKGDIQDGFIQKVKFISSHGMFSLWIGYGLVVSASASASSAPARPAWRSSRSTRTTRTTSSSSPWAPPSRTATPSAGSSATTSCAARTRSARSSCPTRSPSPTRSGPSAVFFGGTDPGRFVPTYMIYSANVRPDVYLITQNALADDTYMSVERDLYGDEIWIPSKDDSAAAFSEYVTSMSPEERAAKGVVTENGRVQVTGALSVMDINGILTRKMFDHERLRRDFYLEESYVIKWMYPFLTPHGLIMKINANEHSLNDAIIRNDMEFWDWYARRLLKDPAFRRDFPAQKSFSKLRAAIAGLYADTRNKSRADGDFQKYNSLAAQAFREAVSLYPASPEATFRYIQEILGSANKWDVILDMVSYTDRVDPNNSRTKDIKRSTRVARDAVVAMNALLAKHTEKDGSARPDATRTPFPAEVLKKLSADELDELAEARLGFAEANLLFGRAHAAYQSAIWLQANPAHAKTFDRLWRSATIFQRLGRYREAARNVIDALTFPEANTYDIQHAAALILAQAGQREECALTIQNAMKFPEAQNFNALLQYADLLEKCEKKNAAVQAINLALPLATTAQPSGILAAADLLLKIDSTTYAPHVLSRLLLPLQRRANLGWSDVARMGELFIRCNDYASAQKCFSGYARATGSADAYLQLALICVQANDLKEARESMKTAWQIDPARVRSLIGQEPWKTLYQRLRP